MEIKFFGSVEKNKILIGTLLDVIKELDIKPNLEILSDTSDFIKYKIRAPSAIIINGKIIFKGNQDLSGNIKKALKKEAEKEGLI